MKGKRLLMVVNSDWFFLSHRLPIARAALEQGYDVHVAAIDTGRRQEIEAAGIRFHSIALTTRGTNPFRELKAVIDLARLYMRLRPDLVHHVTIKPILYGSLVARMFPRMGVVNAVSGLGYMFTGAAHARFLRPLVWLLYRIALKRPNSKTIFQNVEDLERFVGAGMVAPGRTVLIRGSGVDTRAFAYVPETPQDRPVVLLPARLIWDKGVREFIEAARSLLLRGVSARFVLVGKPDNGNPRAVPSAQLQEWVKEGVIEWWGHRSDMPAVFACSSIVALPTTYPEGVPKALIEAAAVGRPIVTTDSPGCRDIVQHGVTGILIPQGDVKALVLAIESLLEDPALRHSLGVHGARRARTEFSVEGVVRAHLGLYHSLLTPVGMTAAAPDQSDIVAAEV